MDSMVQKYLLARLENESLCSEPVWELAQEQAPHVPVAFPCWFPHACAEEGAHSATSATGGAANWGALRPPLVSVLLRVGGATTPSG